MRLIERIVKPEWIYLPDHFLRRIFRKRDHSRGPTEYRLPCGLPMQVDTRDNIGSQAVELGLFDLVVSEALWRLTKPGDLTIDVGANIGCMTAILAARATSSGRVICFEPHPVLFSELAANISRWKRYSTALVDVRELALSSASGQFPLNVPIDFEIHRGQASLESTLVERLPTDPVMVNVSTLDSELGCDASVAVMKVDVEGHELSVLQGATHLLGQRRIQNIVFEEHLEYPSDVSRFLEAAGMRIFRLHRSFLGPRLLPPDSKLPRSTWEATSFVATFDQDDLQRRFAPKGWGCLKRTKDLARTAS